MITARAKEEGGTVEKEKAVAAIRKYIEIFCGSDVAKGLGDKDFHELQPQEGEKPTAGEPEVTTAESTAFNMIFSEYLTE